eukprot:Seg3897.2 transcript_id=Seg3897.2/GoldUCD/mRNA.D3Y31 product="Death-associated protein 1" protein_id=Seg3897.2/GoldUCD/D3Y31
MSSNEPKETLAGHPPAVKVGGMRVGQHHVHHPDPQKPAEKAKEEEEFQTEKPDASEVIVGGAVVKGNKDNPPDAVNVAHQKPSPTNQKPFPANQKNVKGAGVHLSQPRKFNN